MKPVRLQPKSGGARQRGAAVILAMLIVMLAATLAAYMAQQQNMWQQQAENQFNWGQARKVGIAAIDWARAVLADDVSHGKKYNHPGEIWTKQLPAATVENGEVTGLIEDQQGLFNLNNLVKSNGVTSVTSVDDVKRFQRLLALLDLPTDLAVSLADWMDTDSDTQYPGGAEDAYYLSLPQPYRAANRPLAELDELLLVKGFDAATVKRLRPYVSTLPSGTLINVNFAPPEVLAAVTGEDIGVVKQWLPMQLQNPGDLMSIGTTGFSKYSDLLVVQSSYFMVRGYANFGKSQVVMEALLHRNGPQSTVVWQNIE